MRLRICLLAVALTIYLNGACARTSPYVDGQGIPMIDPQLEATPAEATLCIYRPFRFSSGLASPLILIDGERAVVLHNAGYARIFLWPGKHLIATTHSKQWVKGNMSAIMLEVQAGQTYYLEVLRETRTFLIFGAATDFLLALIPEELARDEVRELYYLKPIDRYFLKPVDRYLE